MYIKLEISGRSIPGRHRHRRRLPQLFRLKVTAARARRAANRALRLNGICLSFNSFNRWLLRSGTTVGGGGGGIEREEETDKIDIGDSL